MSLPPDPSTARLAGPWAHHDVSANGIRLHVAELGEGPLVLLLHGFPEFWWAWRGQLTALAEAGYRAVAVDLRGYGDSDKPPRGYDGWTLAGDVAGLVKALGEQRAHLVGHAWGGMLAWTLSALHPRLVNSITVLGGAHPLALRRAIWLGLTRPLRRTARAQARSARHLFAAQLPRLPETRLTRNAASQVEALLRGWSGPDWRQTSDFAEVARTHRTAMLIPGVAHSAMEYYRWSVRSQFRSDGRHFAEAVDRRATVPVLQVHGRLDPCFLPATAARSSPWTGPRSQRVELPGVGHFPHHESPDRVNDLLVRFLTRVTA
ncbi:alpha/beta hydrolase [Actinoalloteichus sp. AHMU CJ021]|uniref:Pimeloyl-ACP methyl ester carboxylesterase n=1 Tax=Actinoalloteichus caeruleus DSM 43889 TaxID=1120930 RepID=A0ABT1JJN2_ACTCY|nr:alpha/beta hydrolase [Actinoalloteichus caeruleus]AUS78596.1 alpha/beta hydrolase [Actinoalloteichus sp. AHMU CJ021]MCP2332723.1 Pimeloyl-ACP methyl ester carboxylesterase [Actinoalloteichus caeruleus DSM 43889]